MEGINELPDELLLKILSSLPRFEETVPTALISKRWRDLWKLVPDLKFDDISFGSSVSTDLKRNFVYKSLKLNNQALERLHLKLRRNYVASTISALVQAAVDRSVRVVRFDLFGKTLELPSCLSTCRTLNALILCKLSIEVVPHWFLLPSLKTLHLRSVKFSGDKSVASLLQICPVLEDLVVHQTQVLNINVFTLSTRGTLQTLILAELSIEVFPHSFCLPSLKTLHLFSVKFSGDQSVASFLQICPVLERLVVDQSKTEVFNIRVPTLSTCETLRTLILSELSIEVVPQWFRLPSLKTLHLLSVKFSGDQSVASFLKMCPALERLVVSETKDDNVMISNIDVPTLRSLSIRSLSINNWKETHGKRTYVAESHGFVIKAPSLTELNFEDTISNFLKFEPMPEVIKANIEVICDQSENFIGSLNSIQHLSLCSLTSRTPYPKDFSFSSLKHLELCTCSAGWANLLVRMLNDAPKVRSLKLKSKHKANYNEPMTFWKEPTVVPKCLSKHLEILEWRRYEGTEQERNVAEYILANATCLKMATFSTRCRKNNRRMVRKLKRMDRKSKICKLAFY